MIPTSKTGSRRGSRSAAMQAVRPEADAALRRARRGSLVATVGLFLVIAMVAALWVATSAPSAAGLAWAVFGTGVASAAALWIHDARETRIDALYGVRER